MLTVPVAKVCAEPEISIETLVGSEEFHTADAKSCASPLLNTPVAVNERLIPSGTELPSFEIRMKTRVGEVTCRPSELLIDPELAVTVVVPTETPVATPLPSIEAIPPGDAQFTS